MHKTKKKTAKLPKPIKVKKEKSDEDRLPQPMSHYLDDRLELVKQVFGTLKPKTIINLAPDFLKSQGLEEIEEACLNELLCISTKRLKSIIAATKCPSDTESSDDDDVQRKEEHVSLEEISSDSEIEGGGTSKKVKKKKSSKIADKHKNNAKTEKSKTVESGANPEDGQISVLELLELQARARAIRSQLALEPVTKIEVDSDVDVDDKDAGKDKGKNKDKTKDKDKREQKSKKDKKSNKPSERKRTSSTRESQDSTNTNTKAAEKESERKTKKIKLKRNYRNPSSSIQPRDDENKYDDEGLKEKDKNPSQENGNNRKQDHVQTIEKVKNERSSRSASPDVIPILAEPETLLINDSSDEAEVKDNQSNETEDNPQKEDKNVEIEPETTDEATFDSKTAESEEGEMCARTNEDDSGKNPKPSKSPETNEEVHEKIAESCTKAQTEIENSIPNTDSEKTEQKDPCKTVHQNIVSENSSTAASHPSDDVDEDEDRNDDVISLGEDLEDEMNEQLENEVNGSSFKVENSELSSSETSKKKPRKEKSTVTASEDDNTADNQSWHSRYMKSSKVSKVLAASRLGKRVRDKIKKSKDTPRESVEAEKGEPVFSSKHEDGSLEQYKELLELRNRKSK